MAISTPHVRVWPGSPAPLGATWDGKGVNFALFSAHAEKVELCLFDRTGNREVKRIIMPERTCDVWHCYLPDARPGDLYGYRVHGPYAPQQGHRFNHNKLLLDPYARALSGNITWSDAHFSYKFDSPKSDLSIDRRDNARVMPKCRVVDPAYTWGNDRRPNTPFSDTFIYETHVRGFSMRNPDVPSAQRGTFAGLAAPASLDHLVKLGVTAVEIMPVHYFVTDRYLQNKGLRNYWGYNTLNFFSADPLYMPGEFQAMVKSLHSAGIEVILDVVYNHTAEGNEKGPTFSFRGIDNASYYRLVPGDERHYINDTGCGNTLNLSHPRVLQMVMDSLRFWVTEMHVDGFRFDLSTTLGREPEGFDPNCGFFDILRQDPVLSRVKLIAEPWDIGPGGYQVGNHPPGWAEWNDRYRDTVRRFWRGDAGMLPEMASRLTGSSDLFDHQGRPAWTSINYFASHDGFTLNDLVSYNDRHNLANGEEGRDGHGENFNSNNGVEGPTDDADIIAKREQQKRNLLTTLFLSQGTPMLLSGDEMGHTQDGNNNPYCQDNETTWLDWNKQTRADKDLLSFTKKLVAFRHQHPVLRRPRFLHGWETSESGIKDIIWFNTEGKEQAPEEWRNPDLRHVALLLNGKAGRYTTPHGTPNEDDILLILLNASHEDISFRLPTIPDGNVWKKRLDTMHPPLQPDGVRIQAEDSFQVKAHSIAVFSLAGHHD